MKKLIFLIIVLVLTTNTIDLLAQRSTRNSGNASSERLFTPEDLLSCDRVGGPKVSPAGNWLAYRVGYTDLINNKTDYEYIITDLSGKAVKKIKTSNAIWAPDGKSVIYYKKNKDKTEIYSVGIPKGKDKKIKVIDGLISNLSISPDGKNLSYTKEVQISKTPTEKYPDLPKANVKIWDKIPARHWDEWVDEFVGHLFIIPLKGGEPYDVMKNEVYETPLKPWGGTEDIAWAPESDEIAYTSKKVDDYMLSTNSDIYIYSEKNRSTKNITEGMNGFDKTPHYSSDGRYIAFHSQERAGFESDKIRLMVYDRKTEKIKDLTSDLDQWVYESIWSQDSRYLYFSAGDGGTIQLYRVNVDNLEMLKLTEGWFNYGSGMDISPDGETLFFCREDMQKPLEVFSMDLKNKSINQLSHVNDDMFKNFKSIDIKERWVKSTDGKQVQCWVLYPPDFNPNNKYPMITYCQGGPQNTITQKFHYRWNWYLMASNGYVVILPNRRGLPGFGQDWNDAISLDWGGMPMQDILAATDEMIKEPYIDKNRLCAVGASAGGYATFWLAGNHNKRYKAFVSHSGVFNLESMYGSTEELWFPNWEYGGPYWEPENKKNYDINSPHRYSQNWDTPILISTGGYDFRVPYTQSLEAFTVAQVKGIPSKLIFFPEESHLILSLQEAVLWYHEYFEFLDKYCKSAK